MVTMIFPEYEGRILISRYEMVGIKKQNPMPAYGIMRPVKTIWVDHSPDTDVDGYVFHHEGKIPER